MCPSAVVAGDDDDGAVLLDSDAGRCCGREGEGRRVPALLRGRPPPRLLPEQDGGGELHRPARSFLPAVRPCTVLLFDVLASFSVNKKV